MHARIATERKRDCCVQPKRLSEKTWIATFIGRRFYPLNPDQADVDIRDIAHGLSNMVRFSGQIKRFYSVAEHSLVVASLLPEDLQLLGLMHDAAEAYIPDLSTPVKHSPTMGAFIVIENRIMRAINMRFELPSELTLSVKRAIKIADRQALRLEVEALVSTPELFDQEWHGVELSAKQRKTIHAFSPKKAERLFLRTFRHLYARYHRGHEKMIEAKHAPYTGSSDGEARL